MIFIIVFLVCGFILLIFKNKKYLHMLQQNLYNENNRYLSWLSKNLKYFLDVDVIILLLAIIAYFAGIYSSVILLIMSLLALYGAFVWNRRIKKDQNKKPLVVTPRVKRLIVTTSILFLIIIVIMFVTTSIKTRWLMILIFTIMMYLDSILIVISNIINRPVEGLVTLHYRRMAVNKLRNINGLKVIGITGSYGKTSSKNILADILNVKYNTFPSPKNLNTPKGLMTAINNQLDKFCEIFIAEMGAYKRGEVKELCDFVHPKYGILTRIGTAHLMTFGSQENIQKGKFELIESLPSDGFGVLNGDDPLQVNYKLKNKVKIIWIGIDNKDVDVRAENIKCDNKGTTFDCVFKGDEKKYKFNTKLLGNHNVYNILAGIAFGREFGISIEDLQSAVSSVRAVEHRLELKRLGNFYQIDDAYNSNPIGAESALKVLNMMPGVKVVVTPGMIELGDKEDEYNKEFGKQISKVADYVVLVGEKKTKPIYEGLLEKGFDKDKIMVLNDVRESYKFVSDLANTNEVYALFENDLPDTFNE
ncbi:MAG: UDP-N-acetylmuramoyl-tripeptide--D-alanyl-D-alanine ligase [Bacilli bacterium]|nr:UDP-N-acetylmuramoyl-tripeptide--D-alanyl-D-alanine ligase [Bacilli bacterium]